jgi:NADP-dependent 3-hydroxy acid dehydrogenase YdfG
LIAGPMVRCAQVRPPVRTIRRIVAQLEGKTAVLTALGQIAEAHVEHMIGVNVKGTVHTAQEALPC